MNLRVAQLAGALLALGAAGCARDNGPRPTAPVDAALELVEPATERLEPAVAAELKQELAQVRRLAGQSGADRKTLGSAYGELGRRYHAYELYRAALPAYEHARRLLPDEHRWAYYLGQVYRSLYDLERARATLDEAHRLAPADEPTLIALAQVHREARRFEEATRLLEGVLSHDPDSVGALLLMATLASDSGDAAAAVKWYERLLEVQPGATRLHQPLAMAYRSLNRPDRARDLLRARGTAPVRMNDPLMQALETLRSGSQQHKDRGIAAYQRGDFEGAIEAFQRAVEIDPGNVGARLNLGSALASAGRASAALEHYRRVIELDPGHAMARFNLGVILALVGDSAESQHQYEEALRIDPDYRDPRFNLANALRQAGRRDLALEHYERITRLDPRFAPAHVATAVCLIQLEQLDDALARLEQSLEVLPAEPTLTLFLARLLAASPRTAGRNGARALLLAQGLVEGRRDAQNLETLAMALAEVGRFDAAVQAQREALTLAREPGQLGRLRQNLELYQRERPCRDPAIG